MYPVQRTITIRLTPAAAEALYYEMLSKVDEYTEDGVFQDEHDEIRHREVLNQLERGLRRHEASVSHYLDQLRRLTNSRANTEEGQ